MLVYQALLLAGYGYAHWLGRFAPRKQAAIHLSLFLIAALMLPIGLSSANPPVAGSPYFWVPWLLLSSIGPLFLAISAQAPLIQRWFGQSGGGDPYPLYAASNLGSFAGLIAYPLIVEPLLPVHQQSLLWSFGYGLLALLIGLCALRLPKNGPELAVQSQHEPKPTRSTMARWIVLAAIPSGLMLSTSLHLTTDIVAMPLIWVLPLGLYLLSFSAAFATSRGLANLADKALPFCLLFSAWVAFIDSSSHPWATAALVLLSLFVIAVSLHSRMFDLRPPPEHLTRFYLAMSIGGVLGGLFCALIAPLVFDWTYEHPILLIAAALSVTQRPLFETAERLWKSEQGGRAVRWLLVAALFISLASVGAFDGLGDVHITGSLLLLALGLFAIGHRLLFTGTMLAIMMAMNGWHILSLSMIEGQMTRSYFGIYSIGTQPGVARMLVHGTTVHGIQMLTPGEEQSPTTYYAPQSGIGLVMAAAPALFGDHARIDVVGLGAGTLACYAKSGQTWHFYEIDPAIADIARNPAQFTFLSRCLPGVDIKIGDARLVLAKEPSSGADLLAIDAFSSDSVPMHLLTTEAFETYRRRLTKDGLLMVHISNRYLDLRPVLAAAAHSGWTARIRLYHADKADQAKHYTTSMWVAMSPSAARIDQLERWTGPHNWSELRPRAGFSAWTDGHGSILPLLFSS